MRASEASLESRNAAVLLLNLKALAKEELVKVSIPPTRTGSGLRVVTRLIPSQIIPPRSLYSSEEEHSSEEEEDFNNERHIHSRLRTVSVSSQADVSFHVSPLRNSPSPSSTEQGEDEEEESTSSPSLPDLTSGSNAVNALGARLSHVFSKPPSTKLVGTTAEAPVKDVLKRKFSWKNYPELESYLVSNREQYLTYSSQLNYTSEQKQYNNKLTQGLLELASSEGYVFEDFTFAAIRDRIRCYYKSFVQAVKKKKRKKRV